MQRLRELAFSLGIVAAAAIGVAFPALGAGAEPIAGPITFLTLFAMSATLPFAALRRAAADGRALGAAFGISQVLLPLAALAIGGWLPGGRGGPAAAGLVVTAAVPCTLATATVYTRIARGDDGLAMVFTTLSNLASVIVLPGTLVLLLGTGGLPRPLDAVRTLVVLVPLPIALGQFARRMAARRLDAAKPAFTRFAQACILAVVVTATARVAGETRGGVTTLAPLLGAVLLLHGTALAAAWTTGGLIGLPRPTRIGVLFAGSQKTLLLGVAVVTEHLPAEAVPAALAALLVHHVAQLVVDAALAGRMGAP